jgi:Protein of unknown function (DUF2807).
VKSRSLLGLILVVIGIAGIVYVVSSGGKSPLHGLASFWGKEIDMTETFDVSQMDSVEIGTGSVNLVVEEGTGSEAVVRLEGSANPSIAKKLRIASDRAGTSLQLGVEGMDGFQFGINWTRLTMTVELPPKQWAKFEAKVGSGNIILSDLHAERMEMKTGSGNLNVQNLGGGKLTAEAGSGNIRLTGLNVTDIETKAGSGNVDLDGFSADDLQINVSSGNVHMQDGNARFKVKTGSGNIRLETEELLHDAQLRTGSGNVNVELDSDPESLAVKYRGGSGRGRIYKDGFTYDHRSGDDDSIEGSFGSGDITLDVQTGSGNFYLR